MINDPAMEAPQPLAAQPPAAQPPAAQPPELNLPPLVPLDSLGNHTESLHISVTDATPDSVRSLLLTLIMDPNIEDSISHTVNAITSSATVLTWQHTLINSVIKSLAIMGEPLGLLKVIVMQGKSLVVRDFKSSDPCVVVKLGNKEKHGYCCLSQHSAKSEARVIILKLLLQEKIMTLPYFQLLDGEGSNTSYFGGSDSALVSV